MTTKVTVENHAGFRLEVTFENRVAGEWLRDRSTIIEPDDRSPRQFHVWDGKRIIVQEIP